MTRGTEARKVLQEECDSAIEDIRRSSHSAMCKAHDALARGQITLLRCEKARLETDDSNRSMTKRTAALVGTAAGTAAAAIWTWIHK